MPILYIYQDVSLQRRNSNLHVGKKSKKRYQIICEQTEKDKNKVVFRFSFYCN